MIEDVIGRVLFALCLSASLSSACTEISLSTKAMKHSAHTVFAGRITALRDSSDDIGIATFQVTRVWKGDASETFEMSAWRFGSISGVPGAVKIGAELLVFAGPTLVSNIGLMEADLLDSELGRQRLQELGRGRRPKPH